MMWMDGTGTQLAVTCDGRALLAGPLTLLALRALLDSEGELLRFTYEITDPETGETTRGAARLRVEQLEPPPLPTGHQSPECVAVRLNGYCSYCAAGYPPGEPVPEA
jgi:hypothetical protein